MNNIHPQIIVGLIIKKSQPVSDTLILTSSNLKNNTNDMQYTYGQLLTESIM